MQRYNFLLRIDNGELTIFVLNHDFLDLKINLIVFIRNTSFPRRRESLPKIRSFLQGIPAYAGMTEKTIGMTKKS